MEFATTNGLLNIAGDTRTTQFDSSIEAQLSTTIQFASSITAQLDADPSFNADAAIIKYVDTQLETESTLQFVALTMVAATYINGPWDEAMIEQYATFSTRRTIAATSYNIYFGIIEYVMEVDAKGNEEYLQRHRPKASRWIHDPYDLGSFDDFKDYPKNGGNGSIEKNLERTLADSVTPHISEGAKPYNNPQPNDFAQSREYSTPDLFNLNRTTNRFRGYHFRHPRVVYRLPPQPSGEERPARSYRLRPRQSRHPRFTLRPDLLRRGAAPDLRIPAAPPEISSLIPDHNPQQNVLTNQPIIRLPPIPQEISCWLMPRGNAIILPRQSVSMDEFVVEKYSWPADFDEIHLADVFAWEDLIEFRYGPPLHVGKVEQKMYRKKQIDKWKRERELAIWEEPMRPEYKGVLGVIFRAEELKKGLVGLLSERLCDLGLDRGWEPRGITIDPSYGDQE